MKKIYLIILLILPVMILAESTIDDMISSLSVKMDLAETASHLEIPVKQLKIYLEIDPGTENTLTLEELHISKKALKTALEKYDNSKQSFYTGIVIVGMLIVFASLLIVGFIIDRLKTLKHLDKKRTKPAADNLKVTAVNGVKSSQNDIIAAITAVFLYELETEEESKLLLTWKRASLSMWNVSSKFNMPNWIYFKDVRR
ncbi:OadG family protein [Candidatus Cloacimonadota bacterium]